jgi:two-component system, cell cycle sensor histidine kinase and response regulator CckA
MEAQPDGVHQVLQRTKDRYRLLAENISDVIFTLDLNLHHTYCSPSVQRLRGYTVEEVTRQTLEQVLTPASFRVATKTLEEGQALERAKPGASSEPETLELELTRKGGGTVWAEVKVSFLRDRNGSIAGILGVARDVTARRRDSERLEQERRTFLSVLEQAPYGVVLMDGDGRSLFANGAFTEITGYRLDDIPMGREWFRKAYPDETYRREVIRAWKEDLAGREPTRTFRVLCKDGGFKEVEFKSAALDDGRTVTMLSDITQRVRAEEELRQSGERFRAIANYTYGAEVWVGTDGKPIWVNPGILSLTGYSDDECLAMTDFPLQIIEKADRERMAGLFVQAVNNRTSGNDVEFRVCCRDGSLKWVAIGWQPIYGSDGTCIGHRASIRDITMRKSVEEALLTSQGHLSQAADLAKIVYWELDWATEIFTFNDSFYAFYGTTAEREGGYRMSADEYGRRFILPEDIPMVQRSVERNRAGKGPEFVVDLEHRIIRRNGEVRHILARTKGFRDARGRITRCYGANQDITERKRLEDQLLQAQKTEAVGTLSAGIAHDFKNVLAAIEGFASLGIKQLQEDSKVRRYLDRISRAVERGKDLVGQILTFSQNRGSKFKPIELIPLLRESIRMLRAPLLPAIEIQENFTTPTAFVLADSTQLQQVIINLATNGAQAMGREGGTLTVGLSDFNLTSQNAPTPGMTEGPYLKLSVTDTGSGMDRQTMERIFDPFFTTKRRTGGTGLGLWVVRNIVKKHKGAITVRSVPGEGSTFDVFLPRFVE